MQLLAGTKKVPNPPSIVFILIAWMHQRAFVSPLKKLITKGRKRLPREMVVPITVPSAEAWATEAAAE
eukprot:scaffold142126_cov28-Prasinocladus_malaysianus.AAC.1